MFKFFRKIRYNLMNQNKLGKYFKYALGEIILVVIGILIAFQVNQWNQSRIEQNDVEAIMANLHVEFLENKNLLKDVQNKYQNSIDAAITINDLVGSSKAEIQSRNIDSLFYFALPSVDFYPSEQSLSLIHI